MSDDELINKIRQGDEAAEEELIQRYYQSILYYCKVRCGSRETAEDLTQETFLRLFRYLPSYRYEGKFKTYLFSIASRLCINESQSISLCQLWDDESVGRECDKIHQIEDQIEIRSLLEKLSPMQREAVILRFGEQMSYQEIAEATGCNMWAAHARVKSAIKHMRKEIHNE